MFGIHARCCEARCETLPGTARKGSGMAGRDTQGRAGLGGCSGREEPSQGGLTPTESSRAGGADAPEQGWGSSRGGGEPARSCRGFTRVPQFCLPFPCKEQTKAKV